MLLTLASHPDPFEVNGMPPTYDSMHQILSRPSLARYAIEDKNFVLVILLTCGTKYKKIVLELALELLAGVWL
jgi:hypothetical protein